jgi:hypothetical protein
VDLPVDYAIPGSIYIVLGVVGLILGNIIKTFTALKSNNQSSTNAFKSVFTDQIGGMLTSIAIGFVALLIFSRETIPTKGWYDTLALGAAIAVLSDEQLLSRVKAILPKAGP